jgi:hypothetical protein
MSNGASVSGQVDANKDGSAAVPVEKSVNPEADAPPHQGKSFADLMEEVEEKAEEREYNAEEKRKVEEAMSTNTPKVRKDYNIRRTSDCTWYRKTPRGWDKVSREDIKTYLSRQGVSSKAPKGCDLSHADIVMDDCINYWMVDFAQEIAGYAIPGQYHIGNNIALVTKGGVFYPLKSGDKKYFMDLWNFLEGAFQEKDQLDAFLGWLQQAIRTLRTAKPPKWGHGLALVIIGGSGIGKTSLQLLITLMLAGRATDPKIFFKGDSSFNSQLAENEHWMMSDPGYKGTKAERDAFLSNLKECVANIWKGCHPKGEKQISLPTFSRMTISLNPDPTAMSIIQGMEQGTLEKTLILDFMDGGKFRPNGPGGMNYSDWEEKMEDQLPYFLGWLLNSYQVPPHLFDERYGVRYTNPTHAPKLAAPSAEAQDVEMQEIVRIGVFATSGDKILTTHGLTAGNVYDRLRSIHNPSRDRAIEHPSLRSCTAIGGLMRGWVDRVPEGEWAELNGFKVRRRKLREKRFVYDFEVPSCARLGVEKSAA